MKTVALFVSQATPLIVNQQTGAPLHSQAISLDLLKANSTPTLVTDGNGNHYLIALTSHGPDGPNGVSSLAKAGGRITLQVRSVGLSVDVCVTPRNVKHLDFYVLSLEITVHPK